MPADPDPNDPFGLANLFGPQVMGQIQRLLSWSGGPVNWDLAVDVARGALDADDPETSGDDSRAVEEAGRLADLWLDGVTTLPASPGATQAWTRRAWLATTLPVWKQLVDPVAGRVTAALGSAVESGLASQELPPELAGLLGSGVNPLAGVMQQVGGFVFGAQVGQALGALGKDVLSATEVGLPLGPPALLPANVAAFASGLEVPHDEVRLYLAAREAAHQRLFTHVPWLRAHLVDAVDAFGRGIEVDPAILERAVGSFDLSDPAAAQEALSSGLFEITPTAAQQAALERLETALALVEGWVDLVVDTAVTGRLPHAPQLRETVRRRRASGGPAEQTFATLVGLQLRPRRLREAAALWAQIGQERGTDGRDGLWAHPDLLPTSAHLDDPLSWGGTRRRAGGLRRLGRGAARPRRGGRRPARRAAGRPARRPAGRAGSAGAAGRLTSVPRRPIQPGKLPPTAGGARCRRSAAPSPSSTQLSTDRGQARPQRHTGLSTPLPQARPQGVREVR